MLPTPTASATPGVTPIVCAGDCSQDGVVTVDELVRGINIALGLQPVTNCPPFDTGGDGQVTVDEIVLAVNNALNGCQEEGRGLNG
jgi:hypothetical protein